MASLGAANKSNTQTRVYTANNVEIQINGEIVALVQTMTITRNSGRRPIYQVGTPLFADAPVTQVNVSVGATNMVPQTGSYATLGLTPNGSMVDAIDMLPYDMSITDANGKVLATVHNCYFQQDSLAVQGSEPLTVNVSWVAQDTTVFS